MRRLMDDLHGGIGGIDSLPAGTGRAANRDLQVLRLDLHIHFLRFRKHRNRAGAGVNASLRFSRRHALNPVHAALVLQPLVDILAVNLEDDFLVAAQVRRAGVEILALPTLGFGIPGVHPI